MAMTPLIQRARLVKQTFACYIGDLLQAFHLIAREQVPNNLEEETSAV